MLYYNIKTMLYEIWRILTEHNDWINMLNDVSHYFIQVNIPLYSSKPLFMYYTCIISLLLTLIVIRERECEHI